MANEKCEDCADYKAKNQTSDHLCKNANSLPDLAYTYVNATLDDCCYTTCAIRRIGLATCPDYS